MLRAKLNKPSRLLKVLPNYRFLSQGHCGMCFKMYYFPTLTLIPSISLVVLPLYCFVLFLSG